MFLRYSGRVNDRKGVNRTVFFFTRHDEHPADHFYRYNPDEPS